MLGVLAVQRRFAELATLVRHRRSLQRLALAAVFISVNWLTYIWAVNSGHVVDAALGYYVNPLITVALGVVVLHERLRPAQKVALGVRRRLGAVLTVANGRVPWIALVLAGSFAAYGYLKKDADAAALTSLAIETAVLVPLALVGLSVFAVAGRAVVRPRLAVARRCCSPASAWSPRSRCCCSPPRRPASRCRCSGCSST